LTCALRTNSIWLALVALAPLASGCCLPELSGRCEPAAACAVCPPAGGTPGEGDADYAVGHGHRADRHHVGHRLAGIGHRLGIWHGPGTPPGEVVPLPRFHPVPTRPVFEPLPEYSLPASLVRPLAPIIVAPEAEQIPTPAQPVPDPA
jgi:hypothetical protein